MYVTLPLHRRLQPVLLLNLGELTGSGVGAQALRPLRLGWCTCFRRRHDQCQTLAAGIGKDGQYIRCSAHLSSEESDLADSRLREHRRSPPHLPRSIVIACRASYRQQLCHLHVRSLEQPNSTALHQKRGIEPESNLHMHGW